jgi:hypothetical protein
MIKNDQDVQAAYTKAYNETYRDFKARGFSDTDANIKARREGKHAAYIVKDKSRVTLLWVLGEIFTTDGAHPGALVYLFPWLWYHKKWIILGLLILYFWAVPIKTRFLQIWDFGNSLFSPKAVQSESTEL